MDHSSGLVFRRSQAASHRRPVVYLCSAVLRRVLSPARLTYLKLLQAVTRPELQIDEVDAVIRADVGMTHRLLKYLGSAALGFRTEITSVRHGLALLGREQTRRFVSLVALGEMGSDRQNYWWHRPCGADSASSSEMTSR